MYSIYLRCIALYFTSLQNLKSTSFHNNNYSRSSAEAQQQHKTENQNTKQQHTSLVCHDEKKTSKITWLLTE